MKYLMCFLCFAIVIGTVLASGSDPDWYNGEIATITLYQIFQHLHQLVQKAGVMVGFLFGQRLGATVKPIIQIKIITILVLIWQVTMAFLNPSMRQAK